MRLFGRANPKALQHALYFYLTCGFGFRGCHESRQLKWGDVTMGKDEEGDRYLQLDCERITKTRQGLEGGHCRAYNPRVYEDPSFDRDPISLYELFTTKRPQDMRAASSPFYLSPRPVVRQTDDSWYKSAPMGINTLARIIPSIAEAAGFQGRVTNHSLRRTACQNLLASNIPSTATIQLTGHKSVDSLNNYAVATKRQRKEMSKIATGQTEKKRCVNSDQDESLPTPQLPPVAMPAPDVPIVAPYCPPPPPHPVIPVQDAAVGVPPALPRGMAGLASAANGMFAGAHISGGVINLSFNFQPQTANNTQMDISNTQQSDD